MTANASTPRPHGRLGRSDELPGFTTAAVLASAPADPRRAAHGTVPPARSKLATEAQPAPGAPNPRPPTPSALERLDGVGAQLAAALRRHFRGDAGAMAAIERVDLQELCKVEGVSERRALDLVRQVKGFDHSDRRLLRTEGSRRTYETILERIQAYAATAYGRNRLRLLAPLPDVAAARTAIDAVLADKARVAGLDRDRVAKALRRIHPPTHPVPVRQVGPIVVCESEAIRQELQQAGLEAWVDLAGPEALAQSDEADLVIVLYDEGRPLPDIDHLVELPASTPPHEVAPEMVLAWYRANKGVLQAAHELASLLGQPSVAGNALELLAQAEGTAADPTKLPAIVEQVRREVDEDIRQRVATLSLRGDEILAAMGAKWPPSLRAVIEAALARGRQEVLTRSSFDVQAFLPGVPVTVNEDEVARVVAQAQGKGRIQAYERRRRVARALKPLQAPLEREVAAWLDYDVRFALGCFAVDHDLHAPVLGGPRLRFDASLHLELATRAGAEPIAYALGDEHPVAILTGANSGGKTTLLEHVAQLVVMARLGLPVVGQGVEVPWIDELHMVSGRKSLDAGAFESFLRSFLPVVHAERDAGRRMILADEVEAMTELSAAGRILAFFVDRAAASGALCILVSHMADAILAEARHPGLRTDGIQATGLDASFRLVVDRAPRMGVRARSTPELIVQRLALTAKGKDQALFGDLLARFQGALPAQSASDPPPQPARRAVRSPRKNAINPAAADAGLGPSAPAA